jgi:hypothetical protein
VLPAPEPTPARPQTNNEDASPLPPPPARPVAPQETRSTPRTTQRATAAQSGIDEASGETKEMPFGIRRIRSEQAVVPAGYATEATGTGNPLRGSTQRAIGSGVIEE